MNAKCKLDDNITHYFIDTDYLFNLVAIFFQIQMAIHLSMATPNQRQNEILPRLV